ncbi:MAG: YbhB/YbcL family Raf kinase inhibitor-like protein [Chitinophaga sp.]|uniref:YbhB/YbcL family Raf kinase inhibitor-like protein n=1 Tax=Chitinophaga sp. TaxID=1869181 RepID=UPI0025BCC234|nr:YbhB/YbcL family Raf kinase inhibitor-like protein [Chitinophaga sp.]MBV8251631.1 YbhB/YbcL family Raf kinase inhibitor-like protein [Chitinophaga sp.]
MSNVSLRISSAAFVEKGTIPTQYTCDGIDISPPLEIDDIPPGTASLAIIVDDPDAPAKVWTHWVAWNIPVTSLLQEHYSGAVEGVNDFGHTTYNGPCPPKGAHCYQFRVFALDCQLSLQRGASLHELITAMRGHILAKGLLTAYYSRK